MALWRMSFLGAVPSGEVFSHSVHANGSGSEVIADVLTTGSQALTALLTTASGIQGQYTNTTVWQAIKAEEVDPTTGEIIDSDQLSVSRAGTNTTISPLPPSVAVCVTLRSLVQSRRGRGRFYLPPPHTGAVSTAGRIGSSTMTAYVTSLNAFLAAFAAGPAPLNLCVYSRLDVATHEITSWDVGDVFDSMRSRRNKLVEGRQGGVVL